MCVTSRLSHRSILQQQCCAPQDHCLPIACLTYEAQDCSSKRASMLQVYKGRLRSDGREVAVKVQRPNVRESIALDIFILRFLAKQARERLNVRPPVTGCACADKECTR